MIMVVIKNLTSSTADEALRTSEEVGKEKEAAAKEHLIGRRVSLQLVEFEEVEDSDLLVVVSNFVLWVEILGRIFRWYHHNCHKFRGRNVDFPAEEGILLIASMEAPSPNSLLVPSQRLLPKRIFAPCLKHMGVLWRLL